MQDKHLYEYAVVRVVPRVEREEFLNAGIVLYCRQKKFLQCIYKLDKHRLQTLCDSLDCSDVEVHLRSFENICNGNNEGGSIGSLDTASRFRWLTATRSTIIQTSKVHPGFCKDPEETLNKLFEQLVL